MGEGGRLRELGDGVVWWDLGGGGDDGDDLVRLGVGETLVDHR